MAGRNFLFVPGPTNVPDRILRAMDVPMEDHRSPIFPALARECLTGLKPIFKTKSGVPFIFPSSGTGLLGSRRHSSSLSPLRSRADLSVLGSSAICGTDMCQRLWLNVEVPQSK